MHLIESSSSAPNAKMNNFDSIFNNEVLTNIISLNKQPIKQFKARVKSCLLIPKALRVGWE